MLLLGVDPGLVNTGWSVIDFNKNAKLRLIESGLIVTKSNCSLSMRLSKIFQSLNDKLNKYKLSSAGLEKTLVNVNAHSSMDLAMARSVILLYFGQRNLNYREYLPTFIKKSITGNGKADKDDMGAMLNNYLDKDSAQSIKNISHHEVDSIAIAICHGFAMESVLLLNS